MHIRFIAIALLLFFKSAILFSQTCDTTSICTCVDDDLNPAGIMIGHEHPKGVWKLSYRYMNMMMDGNQSELHAVDDNTIFNNYIMSPKTMQMDMHMLMAMYGITDRLSIMTMFNYNVLSMQMKMFPVATMNMPGMNMSSNMNTTMTSKTNGIGDIQLYAVYELLNKKSNYLFLSGGINLPAGSIYAKGKSDDMMYPSMRLPYMMQLGSGTIDFLPGITYLLKYNEFSFGTQVTSVLRPFNNTLNYHLGNQLTANFWAAYKWLNWISTSVRIEDTYTSLINGNDAQLVMANEPSANPANYGGQLVNAHGGLNFYFNRGFLSNSKLSVEYGIPVYQFVNGIQLGTKSTINASWMFSF
jgi:hypothetical protein